MTGGLLAIAFANALLLWAPGLPVLPARISRVLGAYSMLSFTGRALVMVILQPKPGVDGSAPIAVLYPDYAATSDPILRLQALALLCFVAGLHVSLSLGLRAAVQSVAYGEPRAILRAYLLVNLMALGSTVLTDGDNRATSLLYLASYALLARYIFATTWRTSSNSAAILALISAISLTQAVMTDSKTPILTLLLAYYLGPHRRGYSVRSLVLSGIAVGFAFIFVQNLKGGYTEPFRQPRRWSQFYDSVIGRFDGLVSVAYAYRSGPGSYAPDNGVGVRLLTALVPDPLLEGSKPLSGVEWGERVYRVSNGVSYAEGFAAEGYVFAGTIGVVLWAFATAALAIMSCAILTSQATYLSGLGGAFLLSTAIFERGLVGQVETLGAATTGAFLASIAVLLTQRKRMLSGTGRRRNPAGRRIYGKGQAPVSNSLRTNV